MFLFSKRQAGFCVYLVYALAQAKKYHNFFFRKKKTVRNDLAVYVLFSKPLLRIMLPHHNWLVRNTREK